MLLYINEHGPETIEFTNVYWRTESTPQGVMTSVHAGAQSRACYKRESVAAFFVFDFTR